MDDIDTRNPAHQWVWDDDAEDAFVNWFSSLAGPYTFISENFCGDCRIQDEKTREDLMYKWLHLAFVTGYIHSKTAHANTN